MTLIYSNIVPENDLRLPDALTVKHGPPASSLDLFSKATRQLGRWVFVCGCAMISASCCI
jgi:hypothetical protein